MRMSRLGWLALALPAVIEAQQGSSARPFAPADWYRLTTVSAPAISPDGERIAFTVQTVRESENKYHREVWVVPTSGGAPVRYTSPGTESSRPRWSADGRYLFFDSQRPGGRGSRWAIRMDSAGGEAFQLEYPEGSTPRDLSFAVFTEGDSIPTDSAARAEDPFRRMGPLARPPFDAVTRPLDPARFDGRHFTDMRIKSNNTGYVASPREARRWRPAQIYVQRFDGSAKTAVTGTRYSHRGAVVSPDGRWIAFLADAELRPDSIVERVRDSLAALPYNRARDEAPRNEVDIFVIPAAGGEPRRVARWMGTESSLAWSPDSRRIAFIGRPARTSNSALYVVDAAGGMPEQAHQRWQYEPNAFAWLPDGTLMLTAAIGGRTGVFRVDAANRSLVEVLGGRRQMRDVTIDPENGRIAFASTSVTRPTELHVAGIDGTGERALTSFNAKLNEEIAWADAERFTYRSVGNVEIEGWLMKPVGHQAGQRYPLVLYIHGGPHSQYHEGWFDEFQNLAARGMFVLYTNPRGSSGYGADFTYSTRGRWMQEDFQDLMKAVDIAIQRPDVDPSRLGVTGGSYGGVMTAWITTRTNRFRAAQADRMISNWWSWYGSSDAQGLTEFEFFGKPWDNPKLYDELSPIRYVNRVRTPTLIVQSEEDHRTPMTDAEQWYLALKKLDVPVEFVRYPRSNHDLSRTGEPWLLVDRLGRLRQWFEHWLGAAVPLSAFHAPANDAGA